MSEHKDTLYNIISRTTRLDYEFWDLIKTHFGLETEFGQEGEVVNAKEIILFEDSFLKDMGFYSKWRLMRRIIEEGFSEKVEIPKEMRFKIEQIYNMRNAFAHSIFPNQILGKLKIMNCGDFNSLTEVDKKHKELYEEVVDFIFDKTTMKDAF